MKEINFPALLIGKEFTIEVIPNHELLTVTNKLGLEKRVLVGNTIIDTDGAVFETIEVEKISNLSPWWKFEFFNPLIKVRLSIKQLDKNITLEGLREIFEKSFARHSDIWEENTAIENIKHIVRNSDTIAGLIRKIAPILLQ